MENAYQLVTAWEELARTLDINHSDPSRFTGSPALGTGTLFIAGVNEVWKLKNGFYKCTKRRNLR
jgi:hypothetical protein